jgi:hypothetical protein
VRVIRIVKVVNLRVNTPIAVIVLITTTELGQTASLLPAQSQRSQVPALTRP